MGGLDLEASGAAERINSHQLFVFVPVILCQDPRCGGQGSNGMGVVVVTGCFKHVIKALSWLSWRPPYPVLGLGRAAVGQHRDQCVPSQCGLTGSRSQSDAQVYDRILGGFEDAQQVLKAGAVQGSWLQHPSPAWLWSWMSGGVMDGSTLGQGSSQKAQQTSGFFLDSLIKL